jgi:hypothetical protein
MFEHTAGEHSSAIWIELRQNVIEEQERSEAAVCGDQLGFGEKKGQDGQPLLSLGAEAAKVPRAARQDDVVEVGAKTCCATLEVTVEPGLERFDGGRLSLVPHPCGGQAEPFGASRKAGR